MYAYCMNDPVNMVDPSGQVFIGAAIGGVSGFVSGFVAGAQAGNIWAGLVGGVAGGIVGGIAGGVGAFGFSPKVGAIVGGIVGGIFGGASSGLITKKLEDPNASTKEKLWATGKGAGIGLIVGTLGGVVSSAAIGMSTLKVGVDIGAAVLTTPIACVLGVFSQLSTGRDTEGNIVSTLPDDWQYDSSWLFYWNPDNPQEIDRNSSVTISVIGGFPPYTWSVSGNGFSLSLNETEVTSNALYADDSACGTATIEVIDNYGVPVKGYLRSAIGVWSQWGYRPMLGIESCSGDVLCVRSHVVITEGKWRYSLEDSAAYHCCYPYGGGGGSGFSNPPPGSNPDKYAHAGCSPEGACWRLGVYIEEWICEQ